MERRAAYKRTATTTNNQKQIRVDRMAKQRKESRASKFQTARKVAAEETPLINSFTVTDAPKEGKIGLSFIFVRDIIIIVIITFLKGVYMN